MIFLKILLLHADDIAFDKFFYCFQIGKKLKAQLPLLENRHIFRNIKNTKRLN